IISFISTILTGSLGLYAQTTDVSICPGESRMLRITAPDSEVTYTWYKDGVVISDIEVDTISVNEPGVYVVMSVNAGGCQSALSEPVIVRHNSMIAYNDWIVVAESTSISIQTWANDSIGCVGIDTLHTQLVSEPTQGIVTRGE